VRLLRSAGGMAGAVAPMQPAWKYSGPTQQLRRPCRLHGLLSRQVCGVRHSAAQTQYPWRRRRLQLRLVTRAQAGSDPAGGSDDAEHQPAAQPPQETDPELPSNLPLDQPPASPDSASGAGSPFEGNPFSTPGLRAERQDLNAFYMQIALQQAMNQQRQEEQQQPQQPQQPQQETPAAQRVSSGSALWHSQADDEAPSAAVAAMRAEFEADQAAKQSQRQGLPRPLAALLAAIAGVLHRIKTTLALIPAVARRLRLESLKQVPGPCLLDIHPTEAVLCRVQMWRVQAGQLGVRLQSGVRVCNNMLFVFFGRHTWSRGSWTWQPRRRTSRSSTRATRGRCCATWNSSRSWPTRRWPRSTSAPWSSPAGAGTFSMRHLQRAAARVQQSPHCTAGSWSADELLGV
jgi:hypothetical protein